MKPRFPTLIATRAARLRVAQPVWAALEKLLFHRHPSREWGTYFRFGDRRTPWGLAVSLVDLLSARPGELLRSSPIVSFSPEYISRALDERDSTRLGIGFIHSHPLDWGVTPSPSDDDMDEYFARLGRPYGSGQPYVSLIANRDRAGGLVLSGRAFDSDEWLQVSHLHISGTALERHRSPLWHSEVAPARERVAGVMARWTALAGEGAADRAAGATIGFVGCSGTGSPAIETFARAQVESFVLVDDQRFAVSNLERVHGSVHRDAEENPAPYKVDLMERMIREINPAARITKLVGNGLDDEVLDELLRCDLVIGGTDTLHGRALLGDLASLYLVPAIDVGVLPQGKDGRVTAQLIEITRYGVDDACPFCQGRISAAGLNAELMHPDERERCIAAAAEAIKRGEDGTAYWQGGPPQLPAVGYLTTAAGAMAAGYGLNWLLGTAEMPHQRMQFDLGKPDFAFVGLQHDRTCDCGCSKWLAHGDQGERSATMPAHFPRAVRLA
jgi:hypothetical protein